MFGLYRIYLEFVLYRILIYLEFGLDKFYCTVPALSEQLIIYSANLAILKNGVLIICQFPIFKQLCKLLKMFMWEKLSHKTLNQVKKNIHVYSKIYYELLVSVLCNGFQLNCGEDPCKLL